MCIVEKKEEIWVPFEIRITAFCSRVSPLSVHLAYSRTRP